MKNFLKIKKTKRQRGFTLIEVLVALLIFSLSILAIMATLSKGISNINEIKKRNVAIYLAQEQLEYLRNVRDNYMLYQNSGGWSSFITELSNKSCSNPKSCYFNNDITYPPINKTYISSCSLPGSKCDPLKLDSSTGNYGYDPTVLDSIFIRYFYYDSVSSDEIKIYSVVEWGGYEVVFSENLYNWFDPGP